MPQLVAAAKTKLMDEKKKQGLEHHSCYDSYYKKF
jgi:hypothetical protein